MKVLFVCLGNICRSPTAHGVFQHAVNEAGLADQIQVDSAGTGDWHIGRAPDPRTLQAALQRGYCLDELVARQVSADDFYQFDYMLAMDRSNLNDLMAMKPADYRGHLGLFLEFASGAPQDEVPDPYYGGDHGFAQVLDLVENAAQGLLDHIRKQLAAKS